MTLPYPPPFQDIAALAEHTGLSETTIERRLREGRFPPPCQTEGKRLWHWKTVEKFLAAGAAPELQPTADKAAQIREATRAAASSRR
jgi:predicted DNA-binding transcriptional regulator AlpA